MTKRRGLSKVQKVAKGGNGKAALDGLKEVGGGGEVKKAEGGMKRGCN